MMEITPNEVYEQVVKRAQGDPLVAEILRSCALEAALARQQEQLNIPEETPEQPDEG